MSILKAQSKTSKEIQMFVALSKNFLMEVTPIELVIQWDESDEFFQVRVFKWGLTFQISRNVTSKHPPNRISQSAHVAQNVPSPNCGLHHVQHTLLDISLWQGMDGCTCASPATSAPAEHVKHVGSRQMVYPKISRPGAMAACSLSLKIGQP